MKRISCVALLIALISSSVQSPGIAASSLYTTFTAEVWADNWFALYVNGKKVGEDSVSIRTERSFNSEKISFKAKYPLIIGIVAKDFVENASGLEYIGKPNQQIGDGGLALQISETVSKKLVTFTDTSWKSLVVDKAPLNVECVSSTNPLNDCQHRNIKMPSSWTLGTYNDSKWISAITYTADEVGVKEGYFDIDWDERTNLIWSADLKLDNTVLFRKKVLSAINSIKKSNTSSSVASAAKFTLTSGEFSDGGNLPKQYTCDGAGISPPLEWSGGPQNTESYAIVMDSIPGPPRPGESDPGKHFYLLLYDIPKNARSISQGKPEVGVLGTNFLGKAVGYTPPCSQGPGAKKYTFTIYALSSRLGLVPDQTTLATLTAAMNGKIIASTSLSVMYSRS